MQVKFTHMEFSYLRQIQGYAIQKNRQAQIAQETALEANALVLEYVKCLCRIHGVDDTNPALLADLSGLEVPKGALQDPYPENG